MLWSNSPSRHGFSRRGRVLQAVFTRRARRRRGASVIELVVAVAILLMISASAFVLFSRFEGSYQVQAESSSLNGRAQVVLNQMLGEVELAGYPSTVMVGSPVSANCIAVGFTETNPEDLKFEAAVQPLWSGSGGAVSSSGCPVLPAVNSLSGGGSLPVSTVRYVLQGGSLVRKITDKTSGVSSSRSLLTGVQQLSFRYFCLGQSGANLDTVQSVCGVHATITAASGSLDQQTRQPVFTSVNGAAFARNTVLSSSNPNQGCDHVCSFSSP